MDEQEDHLSRSMTELGDPEALFQISQGRFLAKLSLGLMLLVGGLAANYFWWVLGPANFDALLAKLLIVLPISGGALLVHMYRQRGLYVLIYPTGLLRLRRGEVDSFPWSEVDHVQVNVQRTAAAEFTYDADGTPTACWLPVEVPSFQLWKAGLTIAREDGVMAHFGAVLTDYDQLAEELQKRTFAVLWPEVWASFLDGQNISFGDIDVTRRGLRYSGKLVPWADVKDLSVAQGKLSIKQGGKWLPWVLVDVKSIPNPHVLFALVAEAQRIPAPQNQPNAPSAG